MAPPRLRRGSTDVRCCRLNPRNRSAATCCLADRRPICAPNSTESNVRRESRQRQPLEMPRLDQRQKMVLDPARHCRAANKKSEFDVSSLSSLRKVGGGDECFSAVDDHALRVHRACCPIHRCQRSRVVVDARQSGSRPLVLDKMLREALDDLAVQGGIARLTADVQAERRLGKLIPVQAFRNLSTTLRQ